MLSVRPCSRNGAQRVANESLGATSFLTFFGAALTQGNLRKLIFEGSPQYLRLATAIFEWVATSFAVSQDGRWTMLCEQSVCMPVMSGHTFHFAEFCLELNRATGEKYYRDVARSAVNAAFDFSYGSEDDWYSLQLSPLYVGLEVGRQLK